MNIILLDKDTRLFKASIAQFESFLWTERYWDYGDFELIVPLNAKNVSLITLNDYLKIATSDTLMIIENIEYVSPVKDEGGKFNITGRSLDSILDRRILFSDFKKSIRPEAFILQMVQKCFKDTSNPDRVIDYLNVPDNTEEDIITEPVSIDEAKGTNLGDVVLSNLQKAELGVRINFRGDNTFSFEVFAGEDKSYIVFSENNLLLQEAKVYQSIDSLRTFALVAGNNIDVNVELAEKPKGINRREVFVGASDIKKEDKGYRNELELRGRNELEEYREVKTIEGQLLNLGRYRLRRDFDLGDKITIQNPYYSAVARITEVIQSWDAEGYRIYPGFEMKSIDVISYTSEEEERPKPPKKDKPDDPAIPDDQTPTRLINVEMISAIKTFSNIEAGKTSGKIYQQIYIPNVQTGDEKRPIKKIGFRLRGTLPENLNPNIYSVYCDVFLGSEQKIGTIKLSFKPGTEAYVTDWYNYLTYDKPYIRLYFYVVCNLSGYNVLIGPGDQPFINGLVDIKFNEMEGVTYEPSEEGDDLTYQVGYYWEATSNFNNYYVGNATNVNGIDGVEILVKRAVSLGNQSILELLGSSVTNGNRGYEYDTVELDNVTLTPIETGLVTVPPYEQNFKIPPLGDNVVSQSCQSLGFRNNVFEYIERAGANYLLGKGSNLQEVNMVLRSIPEIKTEYSNLAIYMHGGVYTKIHLNNPGFKNFSIYGLLLDSLKGYKIRVETSLGFKKEVEIKRGELLFDKIPYGDYIDIYLSNDQPSNITLVGFAIIIDKTKDFILSDLCSNINYATESSYIKTYPEKYTFNAPINFKIDVEIDTEKYIDDISYVNSMFFVLISINSNNLPETSYRYNNYNVKYGLEYLNDLDILNDPGQRPNIMEAKATFKKGGGMSSSIKTSNDIPAFSLINITRNIYGPSENYYSYISVEQNILFNIKNEVIRTRISIETSYTGRN